MSNQCNPTLMCCHEEKKEAVAISSRIENCGDCCLIHQQFTLTENFTISVPTRVYMAPDVLFAPQNPFGTVTVSNCGSTPFTVVFKTDGGTTNGIVVPPGGQLAVAGATIVQIDIAPPTSNPTQVCAVFHFDLFLILPQCSDHHDDDDVDINIDNNIGNTSSSSQSSSASSSLSASASSTSGNNSITATTTTTANS